MKLHDGRPKRIMTELEALAYILAYMDENKIRRALEVEAHQKLVFEATIVKIIKTLKIGQNGRPTASESCRLDYIYDDKPLGFEKDPMTSTKRMQEQVPLEEVNLGVATIKRPTYICVNIDPSLRRQIIKVLKEFKDNFAKDYDKMPGLSRNLVELKLPIRPDKKLIKKMPRRFMLEVMSMIKAKIKYASQN